MNAATAPRASALFLLSILLLSACSYLPSITPYRIDIQQGNYLSQDMVSQLKPGMTRDQVRFVLGTPLVTDIFHADRWDYVYYREVRGGKPERRNLTVIFEQDRLARVTGDVVPAGATSQAEAQKAQAGKAANGQSGAKN